MLLLRPLARLAALLVLSGLALGALAVAVACVPSDGWETAAARLGLESAPRRAAEVENGAALTAALAAFGGALAIAAGALVPRRSRQLSLAGAPVLARRRAVRGAAEALAARGGASQVRVRLRRKRLLVDAAFAPGADARSGTVAIERGLHELAAGFGLRVAVRAHVGEKGARVR